IYGNVERRLIGQKHLQTRVFVSKKRVAFMLALMADERTGLFMARKGLIRLLKNQNARASRAAFDLNIFCGRKVNVTPGLEAMPPFIDQNTGFALNEIDEVLVVPGVALALAVAFERDEDLRKPRAHRRRDEDIANGLLPAGQIAMNEPARRQQ